MKRVAFLICSFLYFPLSVVSVPKPDPDYLFVHLHSNRSTGGEVSYLFGHLAELVSSFCHQVDLDIHPAQLEVASKLPKSEAGCGILTNLGACSLGFNI